MTPTSSSTSTRSSLPIVPATPAAPVMASTNTLRRKSSFLARSLASRSVSFQERQQSQLHKKRTTTVRSWSPGFLQDHPVRSGVLLSFPRDNLVRGPNSRLLGRGAFSDVYELEGYSPEDNSYDDRARLRRRGGQDEERQLAVEERLITRPTTFAVRHLRHDLWEEGSSEGQQLPQHEEEQRQRRYQEALANLISEGQWLS